MKPTLAVALLLLSAPPTRADEAATQPQDRSTEAEPRKPAPQLLYMERALKEKQEARDKGRLPPEKYQEFVVTFRAELDAVIRRVTPTPENRGLHAQILARLGPREQAQALAGLDGALAQDTKSPALLVSKGSILYEQRDFQTADALALEAWEASGRKDQRAWALHKMSEGRVSGAQSGESAPRLKPASDFARLEWSIPERHDVNAPALEFLRQAVKARSAGDMPAAARDVQAAMNADPKSATVQELYNLSQADLAKYADTKKYLDQMLAAMKGGRYEEAVAWTQKAYDRNPSDDTYALLQQVRGKAAELSAERGAEPAKAPRGPGPLFPILATFGAGLAAYGGYQIAKSKSTRASDDGFNPSPQVDAGQARRNYINTAVVIGAPLAVATVVFGGPRAWRAASPTVLSLVNGGRQSLQNIAASANPQTEEEVSEVLPSGQPVVQRVAQAASKVSPQGEAAVEKIGSQAATQAGRLLNAEQALIDIRKFTEYALNPNSPDGMHKARVFKTALGYTRENCQNLIDQIRSGILSNPAVKGTVDRYGTRFTVDILVTGPQGQAVVRTGWNYLPGSDVPRLTTVFVKK